MSHSKRVQEKRARQKAFRRRMEENKIRWGESKTVSVKTKEGETLEFYRWDGVVGVSCIGVVI